MTLRDKVKIEDPNSVDEDEYTGGVFGCPADYDFLNCSDYHDNCAGVSEENCAKCWKQEYIAPSKPNSTPLKGEDEMSTRMSANEALEIVLEGFVCDDSRKEHARDIVLGLAKLEDCITSNNERIQLPDNVNHPSHYQGKHECIDEMIKLFGVRAVIDFCKCNVYKYRYRADRKGGEEDIKKAEWYMDKIFELEEGRRKNDFSF